MVMILSKYSRSPMESEEGASQEPIKIRAKLKGSTVTIIAGNDIYELQAISSDKAGQRALKELCDKINLGFGAGSDQFRTNLLQRLQEGKSIFRVSQNALDKSVQIEYATALGREGMGRNRRLTQINRYMQQLSKTRFFEFGHKKTLKKLIADARLQIQESVKNETVWKPIKQKEAFLPFLFQEHDKELPASLTPSLNPQRLEKADQLEKAIRSPAPKEKKKKQLSKKEQIKEHVFEAAHSVQAPLKSKKKESAPYKSYSIGTKAPRSFLVQPQIHQDLNKAQSSHITVQVGREEVVMDTVESGKVPLFAAVSLIRGAEVPALSDRLTVDLMGLMVGTHFFEDPAVVAKEHATKKAPDVVLLPGSVPRTLLTIVNDRLVITRQVDFCRLNKKNVEVLTQEGMRREYLGQADKVLRPTLTISLPLSALDHLNATGLEGLDRSQLEVDYHVEEINPRLLQHKENLEAQLERELMRYVKDKGCQDEPASIQWVIRGLIREPEIQQLVMHYAKPENYQKMPKEVFWKLLESDALKEHWTAFHEDLEIV